MLRIQKLKAWRGSRLLLFIQSFSLSVLLSFVFCSLDKKRKIFFSECRLMERWFVRPPFRCIDSRRQGSSSLRFSRSSLLASTNVYIALRLAFFFLFFVFSLSVFFSPFCFLDREKERREELALSISFQGFAIFFLLYAS